MLGVSTALLAGTIVSVGFAWAPSITPDRPSPRKRSAGPETAPAGGRGPALSTHDVADAAHQLEAPEDLRGWEWWHLHSRLDDSSSVIPMPVEEAPEFLIPGPAGIRFGVLDGDRLHTARMWRGASRATVPVRLAVRHHVTAAETSRGLRVAVWDGGNFDLLDEAGRLLGRTDIPEGAMSLFAFSPDGTRIAWIKPEARSVAALPGRRDVRPADDDLRRPPRLDLGFDLQPGRHPPCLGQRKPEGMPVGHGHRHPARHVSGAREQAPRRRVPAGRRALVTTSADGTVRGVGDVATGREVEPPCDHHTGEVAAAVYSPDGRWVASAGTDRTVRGVARRAGRTWRSCTATPGA